MKKKNIIKNLNSLVDMVNRMDITLVTTNPFEPTDYFIKPEEEEEGITITSGELVHRRAKAITALEEAMDIIKDYKKLEKKYEKLKDKYDTLENNYAEHLAELEDELEDRDMEEYEME